MPIRIKKEKEKVKENAIFNLFRLNLYLFIKSISSSGTVFAVNSDGMYVSSQIVKYIYM